MYRGNRDSSERARKFVELFDPKEQARTKAGVKANCEQSKDQERPKLLNITPAGQINSMILPCRWNNITMTESPSALHAWHCYLYLFLTTKSFEI